MEGRQVPTPVSGLSSGVTELGAGGYHTSAVRGGGVLCWGNNSTGQLGGGSPGLHPYPINVSGLTGGVTALAAGTHHSCAIQGGALTCWGSNTAGQIGDGSKQQRDNPVEVQGLGAGVTAIAAGGYHTCAVQNGRGLCWGSGNWGQLGTGGFVASQAMPVQVSGLSTGVTNIFAGDNQSCAVQDGRLKCWGLNSSGELGVGPGGFFPTPTAVVGMDGGQIVLASGPGASTYMCGIRSGAASCTGSNGSGQLGIGMSGGTQETHTALGSLSSNVTAIATAVGKACAIQSGRLFCWGDSVSMPVPVN